MRHKSFCISGDLLRIIGTHISFGFRDLRRLNGSVRANRFPTRLDPPFKFWSFSYLKPWHLTSCHFLHSALSISQTSLFFSSFFLHSLQFINIFSLNSSNKLNDSNSITEKIQAQQCDNLNSSNLRLSSHHGVLTHSEHNLNVVGFLEAESSLSILPVFFTSLTVVGVPRQELTQMGKLIESGDKKEGVVMKIEENIET